MSKATEAIRDEMMSRLEDEYELVYVAYDDHLMDEQVAALVRGDYDVLLESLEEFEFESRHIGAREVIANLFDDVLRDWAREHDEDGHALDTLKDEFESSDEYDDVRFAIEDRDTSDPIGDLASNTPSVMLRLSAYDDVWPNMGDDEETRDELTNMLIDMGGDVRWTRDAVAECMAECGDYVQPFILATVDVKTIYDMCEDDSLRITNPHLFLTNPMAGDGYEVELPGVFEFRRDQLRTDEDAAGYGWDEIAGVVISAYEPDRVDIVRGRGKA